MKECFKIFTVHHYNGTIALLEDAKNKIGFPDEEQAQGWLYHLMQNPDALMSNFNFIIMKLYSK